MGFPYHFIYKHPQFVLRDDAHAAPRPEAANPLLAPALAMTDKAWRYGLRPNLRAQPGLRLLGLGDSFAMGFGVEIDETYLSVSAGRWTQHAATEVEPVHASVMGYNPYNSARYLFGEAATLQPDVVVLQLWVGNDLCGASAAARPIVKGEERTAHTLKFAMYRSHLAMLEKT